MRVMGRRIGAQVMLSVLLSVALLDVALVLPGCSSANRVAYEATATTHVTVQEAMKGWNLWVGQGKATVAQEQAVKNAFQRWQKAMLVVCDAGALEAAAAQTNMGTGGTAGFGAALQQAVANAAREQADLVALIGSFGVKLPGS